MIMGEKYDASPTEPCLTVATRLAQHSVWGVLGEVDVSGFGCAELHSQQ